MTMLIARAVGTDGQLGATLGTSTYEGAGLRHYGSTIIADQLRVMTQRGQRTEREAFDLLADTGWSNGKISIGVGT